MEKARAGFYYIHPCHFFGLLSLMIILTDSPTFILSNSVQHVFFFHIVNETGSFALQVHSFESPRLIVSL